MSAALLATGQLSAAAPQLNTPEIQRSNPYPGTYLSRSLTYTTYLVQAHTFQHWQIRLQNSPIPEMQDAVGIARNAFSYEGDLYSKDGLCYPDRLEFTQSITVTLPEVRIGNLTAREESVIKMVSDFTANHEQLHVADYIASVDRLMKYSHDWAGQTDCESYKAALDKALAAERSWGEASAAYIDQNSNWAYMADEINKRLSLQP